MLAVSSRFLPSLAQTHRVYVRADITPISGAAFTVPVIGGDITMDRDASVRRQGSLSVPFSLADDAERFRALSFGGYCQIRRGILFPDATTEALVVGTFRIDTVSWSRSSGEAQLTLSDRMAQVQDEPFTAPWTPNGLHPSDAIVAAVQAVFGSSIAYLVSTTPSSEPLLKDSTYEEDRVQAINDLASSVGASASFNAAGDFVLKPSPDGTAAPVWLIDASPTGVLVDVGENIDRSAVRNGVAVRGQADADSPPFYALAIDDDPSSATRWGGPFGKVALISTSDAVTTQAQATSTARKLLNLRLAAARGLTLAVVPNPALEPDDVISVNLGDGRSTERQIVNSVRLPLSASEGMTVTCSTKYVPGVMTPGVVLHGSRALLELRDARLVSA